MGIGWVQILNNQVLHQFLASIKLWPSSYKVELMAILSAITTVSCNSQVLIFTDSQLIISKYQTQITLNHASTKQFKFNYWPIWQTLLNIVKSLNIQLNFTKVQAHSDNSFNNIADSLAKNHYTSLSTLQLNYNNTYNQYHILQWNDFPIEHPTRYLVKDICKAHIIAIWSSQKRNSE